MSDSAAEHETRRLHLPRFRWILLVALLVLGLLWVAPTLAAVLADIDFEDLGRPYLLIFSFVVFDAIMPIFPSESLLTTASTLAARDGSTLELWPIILAGALGAVIGDSLLYWLSRTVLRRLISDRVEQAERNEKVARTMEVLGGNAPMLIVVGRFVPGMRFVIAATMGLSKYNYPRFLLWDAIGGTFWASYTCLFSYAIGSVVDDKPVLSIAISVIVTTALLALLYKPLKNSWEQTAPVAAEAEGS